MPWSSWATSMRSRRRSRPRTRSRGSWTRACGRSRRPCATRNSCVRARCSSPASTWPSCSRCCARSRPTWAWRRRSCACATRSRRCSCGSSCPRAATAAGCCGRLPTTRRCCVARRTCSRRSATAVDGVVTLAAESVIELRLATSALEFAGARVELPPEVSEERELELDDARLELAGGPLQLSGVVRYDLRASLGGHEISLEELRALAAATQPLVRLGGEWRALNPKALARARALASTVLHSPGPAGDDRARCRAGRLDGRARDGGLGGRDRRRSGRAGGPAARSRAAPAGRAGGGVRGRAAALPEGGTRVARAHARARPGDAAGRRHGAREDRAADRLPARPQRRRRPAGADRVPDVRPGQLAARAAPVRARTCAR